MKYYIDKPFLTIIVPVYNVEKYLRECVNSILNQSFKDFELVLVDDGSPDECPVICDEYAKLDSRIKVVHQKNGGLSHARNMGIKNANGEYLIFFDSDDVMYNNSLSHLVNQLRQRYPDVLITEIRDTIDMQIDDPEEVLFCIPEINNISEAVRCVFETKKHTWSAPQYIVKKSMIDEKELYFLEGFYHEDMSWTLALFMSAKSFEYYNKVWYVRRLQRDGSITNVVKAKRTKDIIQIASDKYYEVMNSQLSDDDKKIMSNRIGQSVFSSLSFCKKYNTDENKEIAALLSKNIDIMSSVGGNKYKLFMIIVSLFGTSFAIKLLRLI